MSSNQRDFRKDKPKPLRVRTVYGVKILTIFRKGERDENGKNVSNSGFGIGPGFR